MHRPYAFNRMEFSGSLGDLGTLLPLSMGMILINGINPLGLFFCIGLFYIFSGLYFRVTSPVEPMKVVAAYAISTGISHAQIQASCLWIFIFLLLIGSTGLITLIGRYIPKPVIRGVQLSTGILLVNKGVQLMLGTSPFQVLHQMSEPYLRIQALGPIPLGLVIGTGLGLLTLFILDNKRTPAAIVVVGIGFVIGLVLGTGQGLDTLAFGIYLPSFFPGGLPSLSDFTIALTVLVLPQIPMTVGNAVIANADLSKQYFPDTGKRVTDKALCLSMAFANLGSFFLGGIPLCQGAGGLASRYRFGARTGGSNLIIGTLFILLALFLGPHLLAVIHLLPMAALGILLVFAGTQLSLTLLDMKTKEALFVPILIVGITLASNLAAGFVTGIFVAYLLQSEKFKI